MLVEVKAPSPGESVSEIEIAQLLVKNGDFVEKSQIIAELDSDKATLELYSEASGVIQFSVSEGDTINVGDVVCTIDSTAQPSHSVEKNIAEVKPQIVEQPSVVSPAIPSVPSPYRPPTTSSVGPSQISPSHPPISHTNTVQIPSPAAKKILSEKGISPSQVSGTGKNGRITKEDAIKAVPSMGTTPQGVERSITRKKLGSLRRKISQRLVEVKNQTAMLTTFNEVDMQAIFELRTKHKESFLEKHGVKLGFMSFFTKAVVTGLKEFPDVNSMIDDNYKVTYDFYDISIAVSGPRGLLVPVVRNAELLSFAQIEQEIVRLATKARDGQLTIDEMTGGTFTITNGGIFGSMLSTPIINPPQSAILGMHNIISRPVVSNNEIVIKPMMYLAVSYDHRLIDGKESVGFLVKVKESLENPVALLMDGNEHQALGL
ncbi:MAG: 2-oxoglutarate dehydrogenase complex dihydrolipoyllysine-residue succinyltransferase [Flavobacteriaceae bacterium]|nr:2-oxoglutarate dehydrogenase complex dihydrolipoyllysine-residue succinyltransferase [Flavobacteriaceae bacterium]